MPSLKALFSCHDGRGLIRLENVAIEAATLGEAIRAAERLTGTRIVVHDPPKWFRAYSADTDSENYGLTDIHIRRGDADICPKQDLFYPLLPDDIIYIGALAC